jgi:uncharacterized delta-60 repeat protein
MRLTDFGSEFGQGKANDDAHAITIQPDGKIVVGGSSTGSVTWTPSLFAIARYHPDGSLDSSFGGDGKVSVSAPYDSARHRYEGLAVQADGKIVGVGGVFRVYVTRFNTDGTLDSSFNGAGVQHFQYDEPDACYTYGNDLIVQPDGKILVGGGSGGEGSPMKFALARMNADGSFDVPTAARAGDVNLDGVFNQFDIVKVLQAGKYLTGEPASFAEGDWNADGIFDQLDIVEALAAGHYSTRTTGQAALAKRDNPVSNDELLYSVLLAKTMASYAEPMQWPVADGGQRDFPRPRRDVHER